MKHKMIGQALSYVMDGTDVHCKVVGARPGPLVAHGITREIYTTVELRLEPVDGKTPPFWIPPMKEVEE